MRTYVVGYVVSCCPGSIALSSSPYPAVVACVRRGPGEEDGQEIRPVQELRGPSKFRACFLPLLSERWRPGLPSCAGYALEEYTRSGGSEAVRSFDHVFFRAKN